MRLVGLISGGKDSVYNMLQCVAAGHEIVAVANIEPDNKDELDSYMYQSVGQELITLIADALCLPLYRQKTQGKAICKDKNYMKTPLDEVEDLTLLLTTVKKAVNIDGVAVGAIASDYQRMRVENVCSRLGLKCFSYLWRRDQAELLQEMIDANMEAIIIKVACIGLNQSHLGMNIREIQPHLLDLNKKYEANVCGEGGEYETITLDCPLFQRSISITESEKVILSNDQFAPVGFLRVKKASLDSKRWEIDGTSLSLQDGIRAVIKGPCAYVQDCADTLSEVVFPQKRVKFDSEKDSVDHPISVQESWKKESSGQILGSSSNVISSKCTTSTSIMNLDDSSGWCCIGNVTGPTISEALQNAHKNLQRMNYDFQDVVFVNLFVRNLSEFSIINAAYSQQMPEMQPPARACLETVMPPDVGVMLILVAHKTVPESQGVLNSTNMCERHGLHVQSISHWAPANIGPYSQCIVVSGIYYVAGQIPLIPGTMELLNKPIYNQCRLALRHVLRILQAMNGTLNFSNVFHAICYVTLDETAKDIYSFWNHITKVSGTPVAVVLVTELPKKAQLEWEVIACSYSNPSVHEEVTVIDELQLQCKLCVYSEPFASSLVCQIGYSEKVDHKSKTPDNMLTVTALNQALRHCVDCLRKDSKSGTPLCILKLFYKANDSALSSALGEVISSFLEMKEESSLRDLSTLSELTVLL